MSDALDQLHAAFDDGSLPLPARLDAARELVAALERAAAGVRADARDLVAASPRDEDLTATLYWEYDDLVPLALLGKFHNLREMLEDRCPWTYPCPECGTDQRLTSRTALKQLQKLVESGGPAYQLKSYRCANCRAVAEEREAVDRVARHEAYRRRLHELKTMPYREYLRTPEWQERREARLKAARYACQACNKRNVMLNVHHRTYIRRGEELARDLIVLCEGCHHMFHRNGSLAPHGEDDD